ncbi:MAG TPA: 2Fe-2S iron-sulfur cluster-binding protein [Bacteroidia bacterium]|jgi:NADH-quinone oxidoreductase subunit G|nr:2Fe-2S iron-sulfur cluster-binding protein [Bacteroidia bacterium]
MPKVTIDGIEIEVPEGTTILNAARMIGGKIVPPAMCYYSKLKQTGGFCRTCLVKVAAGSAKDPRPMPKLMVSCSTTVQDGMVVQNLTSPEVMEARKGVVEFLLINHPLDCPICDQAGECKLQDLGYEHGLEKTRYEFKRRTFEMVDIGDKIKLHMTRCILCYRCVRVAEQLTDQRVHGVMNRGDVAEISTFIQNVMDKDFSGNVIDVCPVGALTDRTARFRNRIWYDKPMDAHRNCTKCNGKVILWLKGEEVIKVTARFDKNNEVESFICNECRFDHKKKEDWIIEKPTHVDRHSVIAQNHYENEKQLKMGHTHFEQLNPATPPKFDKNV